MQRSYVKGLIVLCVPIVAFWYTNCAQVSEQNYDLSSTGLANSLNSGGLVINQGAKYTNQQVVTLMPIHENADEMYITDDPTCAQGGTWESFTAKRNWTLPQMNAKNTLFVKYRKKAVAGVESECFSSSITHDNIKPDVQLVKKTATKMVSGRSLPFSTRSAFEHSLSAHDTLSGIGKIECETDGKTSECQLGTIQSVFSDGSHEINVKVTDLAGNSTEVCDALIVDSSGPVMENLSIKPGQLTSSTDAHFVFSATDALSGVASYQCKKDTESNWNPCPADLTYKVVEGSRSLRVRAVDALGNVGNEIIYQWTVNTTVPAVTINGLASPTRSSSATIAYSAAAHTGSITSIKCFVDHLEKTCGSSSYLTGALADGSHIFRVEAKDSSGLTGVAEIAWTIDSTAPTLTILSSPGPVTNATSTEVRIQFADNAAGVGLKEVLCGINGNFEVCSSTMSGSSIPMTYSLPDERSYTFSAYAVDRAGNVSTTQSVTWTVDRTAPVLNLTQVPGDFINKPADIRFTATDLHGPVTLKCGIDTKSDSAGSQPLSVNSYTSCDSGVFRIDYSSQGQRTYKFKVVATDAAGNESAQEFDGVWDEWGMPVTMTKVPDPNHHYHVNETVVFQFAVSSAFVYESPFGSALCQLRNPGQPEVWFSCDPNQDISVSAPSAGVYQFVIDVVDGAGNHTNNQDKVTWKYPSIEVRN